MRTALAKARLVMRQGKLLSTDDSGPIQKVRVELIGGEEADAFRPQNYGTSSRGADDKCHAIAFQVNGHKIVIALDEPDLRPRDLEEGEVIHYSREDAVDEGEDGYEEGERNGSHHRIHFKKGRIIHSKCGEHSEIEQTPDYIHLCQSEGDGMEVYMDKDQLILKAGYSEIRMTDAGMTFTGHFIDERWSKD